jgi:hypothetical protein
MSKISYSAVVLDDKSRQELINNFEEFIPDTFEIIAHHMTITMGELTKPFKKEDIGKNVKLVVHSLGFDYKVVAVGVYGYPSKNKIPHITLAVNRGNGGKPFMSNKLNNWKDIDNKLVVHGTVQEVPYK